MGKAPSGTRKLLAIYSIEDCLVIIFIMEGKNINKIKYVLAENKLKTRPIARLINIIVMEEKSTYKIPTKNNLNF